MKSRNNRVMTPKERENITQAFVNMYRGNIEKHTSNTVDSKSTHAKKKLCSSDKEKLQEITMRLLQSQ